MAAASAVFPLLHPGYILVSLAFPAKSSLENLQSSLSLCTLAYA